MMASKGLFRAKLPIRDCQDLSPVVHIIQKRYFDTKLVANNANHMVFDRNATRNRRSRDIPVMERRLTPSYVSQVFPSVRKQLTRPFSVDLAFRRQFSISSKMLRNHRGESPEQLFKSIIDGDRSALAFAITMVESSHPQKREHSEQILGKTLNYLRQKGEHTSKTFRIGMTGPPGAGKSTLIEVLGLHLTSKGHRVAVLAVDPSSARTGGSLLGDRTRMTRLSTDANAYIRPSPSSGTLGGVTRSTNEAILLCEGAGYDIILVETVGVGQSEFAVADMVDMFVLLIPPAGGDELQGIKKGIVEVADLILINKADGDLLPAANKIQAEYISALKLLHNPNPKWTPEVMKVSALKNDGIDKAWERICAYRDIMIQSGLLERTRRRQYKIWMWNHIRDRIMDTFRTHPRVQAKFGELEGLVSKEVITPGMAADRLMRIFSDG